MLFVKGYSTHISHFGKSPSHSQTKQVDWIGMCHLAF